MPKKNTEETPKSKRKSMKLGIKPYKFSWNLNHLIRFTIFNCTLIKYYYYFRFVISRRIIFAIFSALSCSWLTTKIPPLQLCLMDKLDAYNISSFSEAVIHSSLKWSLIIPSSRGMLSPGSKCQILWKDVLCHIFFPLFSFFMRYKSLLLIFFFNKIFNTFTLFSFLCSSPVTYTMSNVHFLFSFLIC